VYKVVDANEKESMTALFMYSAEGTRAPPIVLYTYSESVSKKILENCPAGWGIGLSENGWMTTESFCEFIANIFHSWLVTENVQFPVILYLDGHLSHVTIPLVSFCREKQIELIALYPDTTHIMQPLDITVFHPFKDIWKKVVPKWKAENNISRLTKEHFPNVLKKALDSFTEEKKVVQSGFRASGLMPFNPEAVDYNVLEKKKRTRKVKQDISDVSGVASQTVIEDHKQHLKTFERNLSNDILEEFKRTESTKLLTKDMEKKGLFEYWLSIKNAACGE